MNWGIPYIGSKASICENLCKVLLPADNFYDVFGGGFSITHFMITKRYSDFSFFYFNEIRNEVVDLIRKAINGDYSYNVFKPEWISREDFHSKKEKDGYVKIIWSFGNNGKDYLFGKEIEAFKKSIHNAVIFNEFDTIAKKILGINRFSEGYSIKQRRSLLLNRISFLNKGQLHTPDKLQQLEGLERLQQLEGLERLQQLERLEQLQQLSFSSKSFEEISINKNSTIYCDPPYLGTAEYDKNKNFNHRVFYEWANSQKEPLYISEYTMPDRRFKKVFSIKKRSLLSPDKSKTLIKEDCLFANKIGYEKLMDLKRSRS